MDDWVSVVIPVSSTHRALWPQAYESLTQQTVGGWHAVIVDDTGGQLKPRRDRRITWVKTQGHRGAAVARNLGVAATKTPFVFFLDADDLLVNTALEVSLKGYAMYPQAQYIYGDWLMSTPTWTRARESKVYTQRGMLEGMLHTVSALIPTSVVRKIGGFDEAYAGWEDWEFYVRLAAAGYCGERVASPIIVYRVESGRNRVRHNNRKEEHFATLQRNYAAWYEGKATMGCNCQEEEAKAMAKRLAAQLPSGTPDQTVLEFTGPEKGTVPFRGPSGKYYRGANTPTNRFAQVDAVDVERLLSTGKWRVAAQPSTQPTLPDLPPRRTAKAKTDMPPPPTAETATDLTTCPECGHVSIFIKDGVCQALVDGQPCGCTQCKVPVKKSKKAHVRTADSK